MPPKKNLKLEDLQSVVNELQEEMKGLRSEVEFLKSRNVQGTCTINQLLIYIYLRILIRIIRMFLCFPRPN